MIYDEKYRDFLEIAASQGLVSQLRDRFPYLSEDTALEIIREWNQTKKQLLNE
jgi:hypothetical protein